MAEAVPNLEDLVKQELEKIQVKEPDAHAASGNEVKLNIGGQERTFASAEDVQKYVNDTIAATQAAAQQAVTTAMQNLPGQRVTANQQDQLPQVPKIDLEAYAKALQENPLLAHQLVDQARFGGDPTMIMREMWQRQQAQEQVLAAYQFRDVHPEFQRNPENAEALTNIMQQFKLPFTVDGLEMAYSVAKEKGLVQVGETARESYVQEPERRIAPPSIGRRTSEPPSSYMDYVDDLSADQIAKIIDQFEKAPGR
jgi:hypothetical protein